MEKALDQLPDDVDLLKSLVADQLARNAQLQADKQAVVQRNKHLKAQVLTLQEQLNLALARRYAASSEKISPDQYRLFDEAETDTEVEWEDDQIIVPAHTRKKGGRKKLPESLPRVEVVHELSGAELICPFDGATLTEIGAVSSEQLDIIPAKIQVIRHVRKQYACDCGHSIKTAALPQAADSQEHGIARFTGPYRGIEVPGCLALVSAGDDLAAYRCRYPPCNDGELDDPGGNTDPTPDQPVAGPAAGIRHHPDR